MGEWTIAYRDWASFAAAVVLCGFYIRFRQPTVAAILATAIDLIGYEPTIRKALNKPYEDSITAFTLNSFKFIPSLLAMHTVSMSTALYPAVMIPANAFVALLLFEGRRRASFPTLNL